MPTERVVHEVDYDDDAVVVDRGGGGSSMGVILGILIVLLIVAGVWWFALGPGAGTSSNGGSINVNLPGATAAPAGNGGSAQPGASY